MSELKCPACKTALSKPLPERCPVCNLEGVNRMFLTCEDYEHWKTTVLDEHIKKLRNHKIFVGDAHVLVLMDDGTLFQIEGNKPVKVVENVKSVAAGYNYSLYLDSAGKVHFLGNSGIPFKERFKQGNIVFKEVYARSNIDIFGATDSIGNFYVWGDNSLQEIEVGSERFLKTFATIKGGRVIGGEGTHYHVNQFGCETGWSHFNFDEKYGNYYYSPNHTPHDNETSIKRTADYDLFRICYGEDNLKIKHCTKKSYKKNFTIDRPTYDGFCNDVIRENVRERIRLPYAIHNLKGNLTVEIVEFELQIFFINNYLFEPKPSTTTVKNFFMDTTQKYMGLKKFIDIYHGEFEIYARLESDSSLYVFRKESNGKLTKITNVKGIMDCSEFIKECLYLIDYSNKIWSIKSKNFLKLKQEVSPEELLEFVCEI